MALVIGFSKAENFATSSSITGVATGSGSNRAAYVLLGRLNNNTPTPSSVTVGSDSLTAQGSTFTDADGRSWRLFAGALTVTGSQTVTGTWSSDLGQAIIIGLIWDTVDTGTLISSLQTGAAYTTTPSFAVTSATGNDVISLLIEYGSGVNRSLTASSPATLVDVGGGGTTGRFAMREAGATSVVIDGTWSSTAGWVGVAFNVPTSSGDTTAPVLSSPTGVKTGSSTATIGATTDEGNGTMYGVVTTSATQPSVAQIKAGQDHTGASAAWSDSQSISTTGAKTFSATSLTASTTYYGHIVHTDAAANDSNRVASSGFTTDPPPSTGALPIITRLYRG